MELVLVRHAEPERIEARPGSVERADPSLTPRGREQASCLAGWLRGEQVDHVVTSPMIRARQTADQVAAAHGLAAEVVEGLTEFDTGATSYVPVEELRVARDPRYLAMVEERWHEDGEGIEPQQFRRQTIAAIEGIIALHPSRRVVVVSHGGVINAYLSHVLGLQRLFFFEPGYASISRLAASRDGVRSVVTLNECSHLREAPR